MDINKRITRIYICSLLMLEDLDALTEENQESFGLGEEVQHLINRIELNDSLIDLGVETVNKVALVSAKLNEALESNGKVKNIKELERPDPYLQTR